MPTGVSAQGHHVSWIASRNTSVYRWMIYQQEGQHWKLQQMLPAEVTGVDLESGIYLIRAMNGARYQSEGAYLYIP